jgi:hypothetical protein
MFQNIWKTLLLTISNQQVRHFNFGGFVFNTVHLLKSTVCSTFKEEICYTQTIQVLNIVKQYDG